MAAGHAGAHAGRADVDHHRGAERIDLLEQRVVAPVVHREVLHDRVEVEADEAELAAPPCLHLPDGDLAFRGLHARPRPG